jgi:hypothetical protein
MVYEERGKREEEEENEEEEEEEEGRTPEGIREEKASEDSQHSVMRSQQQRAPLLRCRLLKARPGVRSQRRQREAGGHSRQQAMRRRLLVML